MAVLKAGAIVGPYRLLFPLGKGGMGEVWAGQHLSTAGFQKMVAVKVLRNTVQTENEKLMFLDEAKTAAALQHPAIVPTIDLGEYDGMLFIVMELVKGPSLRGLLQKRAKQKSSVSPAIVAHIGERIAHALDYAHARAEVEGKQLKLIHRDVSPHNILIDTSGVVRLMDFGVARTAVQDHLSRVGTVRGKPSYMAPEQVTGGTLTAQTDVFALGTVLYETASLKRLFGRGEPTKSMSAVLNHQPRALSKVVPGFPSDLSDVIAQALEKKPSDRQKDAGEFSRQLERVLRELPSSSTVGRDLSAVISQSFGGDAFDLDVKIAEFTQADEASSGQEATQAERPSGKEPEASNEMPELQGDAFYEGLATRVNWPGAREPYSGSQQQAPLTPEAPEYAVPGESRSGLIAALLVAVFIVTFALILVVQERKTPETIAPIPKKERSTLKAKTVMQDRLPKENVVQRKPMQETKIKPPSLKPRRSRPRPAPSLKRRKVKKALAPASKKEVWKLIQQLQQLDPKLAAQYQTTVIEIGGQQEGLNALRIKVLKALEKTASSKEKER